MINITIRQLEVFVEVVEQMNYSAASENLFLSQSTVSKHIETLENVLQMTLIDRDDKKNISITPDGQRLYHYAKDIVSQLKELEQNLIKDQKKQILLGTSSLPSQFILPSILSKFHEQAPEYTFVIKDSDSAGVHQMLLRNLIDVGFVGSRIKHQSLRYRPIAQDRLFLATPTSLKFIEAKDKGLQGGDLLSNPLILREEGSGTRKMFEKYLHQHKISLTNLKVFAYADNIENIKEMVQLGLGVSPISSLTVQKELEQGTLMAFPMGEPGIQRNIYVAWRADTMERRKAEGTADDFVTFMHFVTGQKWQF